MAGAISRGWVALVASLGIYFIPLVGPHGVWLVGESLLASARRDPAPAGMAADVAVALASQLAAAVAIYWSLGGGWARKLLWLGIVPLTIALNVAYLSAIPAFVLIEEDTAPELSSWAEQCFVRGVGLRAIRSAAVQAQQAARAWWVARSPDGRDALLRVPECLTTDAVLPTAGKSAEGYLDFFISLQFASRDGIAVVEQADRRTSQRTWWILTDPTTPLQRLGESSETFAYPPIVSRRGDAVAYMTTVVGSGPPVLNHVLVRKVAPVAPASEVDIDLSPFGPASYVVLDVDTEAREVLLWRTDRPFIVSFDGQSRPVSFDPGDIRAQSSTYIRVGDGWVAWDAYKDDGPYQIGWSLGGRSGRHRTNRGRAVTSAAVDPTGSYIAISETTTLSIGKARDVVYVLRTVDGADVFRRYLPRYSRTQVVFFDGGFFGYSDLDGTHVLKIPRSTGPDTR